MASKTLQSNQITFIDQTDSRKLEAYIISNLPTSQIYNVNTSAYSPDWSVTNLQLNADIYLDAEDVTTNSQTTITWYQKTNNTETQIATGSSCIIATNTLSNNPIMTYVCKATYQGIEARAEITFTRTDTGTNGKDGTSVTIDGSAYCNVALSQESIGKTITLYTDAQCTQLLDTSELSTGDSYIVQGFLCVYNLSDNVFICVGTIQGPKGNDAKNIILNGNSQIFNVNKKNEVYPATIVITSQAINTSITSWTYSVDGGKTFLSTAPNGVVLNGSQVTIAGEDMGSNSIVIKASDGLYSDTYTVYKVFDGLDGIQGADGNSAPIVFLTNENIGFSADAQGRIKSTTVTTNIVAYDGTTKVTPTIGTIENLPEGMTINAEEIIEVNNELILPIVITNDSTLGSSLSISGSVSIPIISPVNTVLTLSWSKINTGVTGEDGADAVTFQVYSADGYILSKDTPSITLQTFAYIGDSPIEAEATYQWYFKEDDEWTELTIETTDETDGTSIILPVSTSYVEIHHTSVSFSRSYMCQMTFNGLKYMDVVTIDDKTDTNTIFTSKPTSYSVGDIWIVGNDYVPDGVEVGTVLKSQYTNSIYAESDWVTATKYDDKIADVEEYVRIYKQYILLDQTDGIKMNAIDENGVASEFSTTLSNKQLSFNQADETVAYINNHKMYITEAEIESPLTVTGQYSGSTMLQAPTINIGNFSLVVESNGSLSIVSNL